MDRHTLPLDEVLAGALDRSPDHIALLDEAGDIVWVNRAWIEFGEANGAGVDSWIGRSYLDPRIADEDLGDHADELLEVVRCVVDGTVDERTGEYPCHAPTEQRWFSVDAWAVPTGDRRFVVVAHHNLTPQYFAERQALEVSRRDPVTGLADRRQFDLFVERHWIHAVQRGLPMSIVVVDVDDFQRCNDLLGRDIGDLVLRQVAGSLTAVCRRSQDLAARLGGDEFVAVFPGVDAAEAISRANRVLERFSVDVDRHVGFSATLSAGVGTLTPTADHDVLELVRMAEGCLLDAKAAGKHRVVAAGADL